MKDILHIEIEMPQQMSGDAKKTSEEYHQLKIQFRFLYFADNDSIKEEVLELVKKEFPKINKFEELDNGFDLYFRYHRDSSKVYSYLAKRYFCIQELNKKVVGKDFLKGVDIYRYTQIIQIMDIRKGRKVFYAGNEYMIEEIHNKNLVMRNIEDGTKQNLPYQAMADYFKVLE
jgi:NMD protein affecting ribosome stability and mRNA decay